MRALRILQPTQRRLLVGVLHSLTARAVTHPVTAAALSVGNVVLLYGTGLYAQAEQHLWLDILVHAHFVVAGYLFAAAWLAWILAGVSRACCCAALCWSSPSVPTTPSPSCRMRMLRRRGRRVRSSCGTAATGPASLVVLVLFAQWYGREGRRLDRDRQRASITAARAD